MEIINNINETTHDEVISAYAEKADHIIIVSPYIFDDFSEWFKKTNLSSIKKIELVTSLDASGNNQLKKPYALLSFFDSAERYVGSAEAHLHANNRLHGKIYLFKKSNEWLAGLISSANFTNSGLVRNHEWGTLIKEPALLDMLYRQIFEALDYRDIPKRIIANKFIPAVEQFKKNNAVPDELPSMNVGLLNLLKTNYTQANVVTALNLNNAKSYFLKPHGDADHPVLLADKREFGANRTLHFPKKPPPNDVLPGDLIISFGTGSRALLCLHTSLTRAEEETAERQRNDKNAARWPWYVVGHNHTPYFGNYWWKYNITLDNLRDEFLKNFQGSTVTDQGNSFGAFNYGAGKLLVTREFANFVVDKVMAIEESAQTKGA